ncbi:MAG: sulfatase-like hydrolase/transferase [Mariniphaga sp.]
MRIRLTIFLSTLIFFGFLLTGCNHPDVAPRLPNIVLIMADDMGKECVGSYGNKEYNTPNLDRLASSGIRFDHCYSQPLCTPSRVKIMTGKYNFRNYEDFGYLNPNQKTFANLLKEAGYETCIAGKWQLNGLNRNNTGNQDVTRPYHFGFDEYCLWQLNRTRSDGERYANPLITQNGKELPRDQDAFGPQVFADYLTDFIDRKAGKPFFIYYPMVLPHNPFVPTPDSPEWDDPSLRYDDDTVHFAGMVAYIDKIVGQLEAKLKKEGVWENTLFIFTADNGTRPNVVSGTLQGDIRGGKGKTINTGNHVPLIISWPQKISGGRTFQGIVDFADILPTLSDIANIDPATYETDGKSFLSVLSENANNGGKDETFIHYTPWWGKFEHNRWVVNEEYKLYRDGKFFNTREDPEEKNPLSDLSEKEKKTKQKFGVILREKEEEFPFDRNNKEFQKK